MTPDLRIYGNNDFGHSVLILSSDLATADAQQYPWNCSNIKQFPKVDLALVAFVSSQSYQVAKLVNPKGSKTGKSVYVFGTRSAGLEPATNCLEGNCSIR